jgi:hypothetical protein
MKYSKRPLWSDYCKIKNEQYKIIDNMITIYKRISVYHQIQITNFYQIQSKNEINKGNEFKVDYGDFCTVLKFHESMNGQTIVIEEYYGC